jgi:hypothetical protein
VRLARKDIISSYHVRSEVKNISDYTLESVKVTAHFYDNDGNPIGVTSCYAQPDSIEPSHTATFDSFADKNELSGKPSSFRLSFDWQ